MLVNTKDVSPEPLFGLMAHTDAYADRDVENSTNYRRSYQ